MANFSFSLNGVLNSLPGPLSSITHKAKNALRGIRSTNEGGRNPHADDDEDNNNSSSSSSNNKKDKKSSSNSSSTGNSNSSTSTSNKSNQNNSKSSTGSSTSTSNNSKASSSTKKAPPRQKKPKVEVKYCDKCLKDEEEQVHATHHCSECQQNYCQAHLNLHNTANKTKSHAESSVTEIPSPHVPLTLLPDLQQVHVFTGLDYPYCCAIDPNYGSLFFADMDTIFEHDLKTKELVNTFKESQGRRAVRLCYDSNDDTLIYVLDRCAAFDVVKVSRDGKMLHWEVSDQSPIRDIFVDRVDGTIYTVQHDGIVFIKDGKVTTTLRDNINGNNMFVDLAYDHITGVATDFDNNLLVTTDRYMIRCNKKGKILSKVEKVSNGPATRIHFDPNPSSNGGEQRICYVGYYGVESVLLNATCRMEFRNEKAEHKFELNRGEGIDLAIDFSSGEVYVVNVGHRTIQVFQ